MKSAYVADFGGFLKDLDDLRERMESWYALRLEDEQVTGDHMTQYEQVMGECDSLIAKITASMRVVKNAIVPSSNQYMLHVFFNPWYMISKLPMFPHEMTHCPGSSEGEGEVCCCP